VDYRVTCIRKSPTHHDRHHHISAIGIATSSGVEVITEATAIAQLDRPDGDRYHVQGVSGARSEVIVHACPKCGTGHRILTTTRDHSKEDNLLSLDECGSHGSGGGGGVPPRRPVVPPGPVAPPRPPGSRPVGAGR
jgi:hypothetical protein